LDAAAVADHALVLHAAVLAAGALPVLLGAEDALAEQAVLLGAVGAVVDGLGLLHLAEGPAADVVRAGQADADRAVVVDPVVVDLTGTHGRPPLRILDFRFQISYFRFEEWTEGSAASFFKSEI